MQERRSDLAGQLRSTTYMYIYNVYASFSCHSSYKSTSRSDQKHCSILVKRRRVVYTFYPFCYCTRLGNMSMYMAPFFAKAGAVCIITDH